jgi:hypothetical protein
MNDADDEMSTPEGGETSQGDGSGDPNRDRGFLQDLPPAQVDDDAVQHARDEAEDAAPEE